MKSSLECQYHPFRNSLFPKVICRTREAEPWRPRRWLTEAGGGSASLSLCFLDFLVPLPLPRPGLQDVRFRSWGQSDRERTSPPSSSDGSEGKQMSKCSVSSWHGDEVFWVGGLLESEDHRLGSTSASQTGKRTWVEGEQGQREQRTKQGLPGPLPNL